MAKYNLYNPLFVYGTWDEVLIQNRHLFVADTIEGLEEIVNNNIRPELEFTVLRNEDLVTNDGFPFRVFYEDGGLSDQGIIYALCYYDPLYEVKLGYQEGIPVLCRRKGNEYAPWLFDPDPTWMPFMYDYKLDPDRVPACNPASNDDCQEPPLFDEECVYRIWDPALADKPCWVADSFFTLKKAFCSKKPKVIGPSGSFDFPFFIPGDSEEDESRIWRLAYYDPYLELKQARKKGEIIEYYDEGEWHEVPTDDELIFKPELYRVKSSPKPFDLVTHRELARWINLGNGELTFSDKSVIGPDCIVSPFFQYEVGETDKPVSDDIRVRKWDSIEWTSPTREYLGLC